MSDIFIDLYKDTRKENQCCFIYGSPPEHIHCEQSVKFEIISKLSHEKEEKFGIKSFSCEYHSDQLLNYHILFDENAKLKELENG